MPSFDVVSKVDWHEVDNALNQARKEVEQRYDFKGSGTSIELQEHCFTIESSDEYKVAATVQVLESRLARRKVPLGVLKKEDLESASGGRCRQRIRLRSGLEEDTAKAIVKAVKGRKLKVQVAIQGDSVRVSGKKRDDLQEVIAMLRDGDFDQPLQFENYRD
ncbi:MAG: YajQ family cyclic di-GMP-binding protein [Candidatus Binatia bacterium]